MQTNQSRDSSSTLSFAADLMNRPVKFSRLPWLCTRSSLGLLCGLIISFQVVRNAVILGRQVLRQNKCRFRDVEESQWTV